MHKTIQIKNQGFTLIEILIATAISGLIISAIYVTFSLQEKSQINQQEIIDVQQNIRAAMCIMVNEIRIAGYQRNINRDNSIGILEAKPGKIHFTMDIAGGDDDNVDNDGDGKIDESDEYKWSDGIIDDENENITFAFKDEDDADSDGIVDNGGVATLCRETRSLNDKGSVTTSGLQPMADNIQAICFTYFDKHGNNADYDKDGIVDIELNKIRSVRIAILGRTKTSLDEFDDTTTYDLDGDGIADIIPPANDKFRRRILVTIVKCRNLGI